MASPNERLSQTVVARLAAEDQPACVAVGIVGPAARTAIACTNSAGKLTIDPDSIFEIGSFSKVMTGVLLANMIERGEVKLTDPISKYAPAGSKLPTRGGREITLGDLVSHRSSLPRVPPNFKPTNLSNPYKGFDSKALYEGLAQTELTADIGTRQEYSNFGFMLLSDLLGRAGGKRFDELLAERIFKVLEMTSTGVVLPAEVEKRFVQGHAAGYTPVPMWDIDPALAGAGGIRSSLVDMMRFADAAVGRRTLGLGKTFDASLVPLIDNSEGTSTLFAWGMRRRGVGRLIFHNGQTGGMRSMVVVNPDNGTGAVVLTDSVVSFEDLAFYLVDASMPLKLKREEITLDDKVLDEYVGTYQLTPEFALRIFREGSRLLVQATGQSALPMFAEAQDRFFLKLVDAQLTFRRDAKGRVISVVLHQGGRDLPGPRTTPARGS
ncbi:hypothetical protein DSM104443_02940 [Usitatibacter rugosus]|uniref:Beta-lactamase n=2 Tax=Usitatibacter rugosus TaxID=2732067 RepID=A0A6M4H1Z4_9PROT|nr:hypothetical protein DSM104443_02940 [Usitatibacter rugosus]